MMVALRNNAGDLLEMNSAGRAGPTSAQRIAE